MKTRLAVADGSGACGVQHPLAIERLAEQVYQWNPDIAVTSDALFARVDRCESLYGMREFVSAVLGQVEGRGWGSPRVGYGGSAGLAKADALWGPGVGVEAGAADGVGAGVSAGVGAGPAVDDASLKGGENSTFSTTPRVAGKVGGTASCSIALLPIDVLHVLYDPFDQRQRSRPEELRKIMEMQGHLRRLGVLTLADFLRLGPRGLPSRFGRLGAFLYRIVSLVMPGPPLPLSSAPDVLSVSPQSHTPPLPSPPSSSPPPPQQTPGQRYRSERDGEEALVWPAWPYYVPPEVLVEEVFSDETWSLGNWEVVLFGLKPLLERLLRRASARQVAVSQFELELVRSSARGGGAGGVEIGADAAARKSMAMQVDFSFPQTESAAALQVFRRRFEATDLQSLFPDCAPGLSLDRAADLCGIRLTATKVVSFSGYQRNLFCKKSEDSGLAHQELIDQLTARLGGGAVFMAGLNNSHLPESSWRRIDCSQYGSEKMNGGVGAGPLRPLRILAEPRLVPSDKLNKLNFIDGLFPEKLSEEWWCSKGARPLAQERIYSIARDNQGNELLIFRKGEQVFLHGIFD